MVNKSTWGIISREVFQISLTTYLLLLILETLKTGFVINFIDINYILPVIIISGIGMTVLSREQKIERKSNKIKEVDIYYIALMSLGAGGLVYIKTSELGWISIAVSVVTSLILLLISFLIFTEKSD
jgi:hypothetical protein